VNPLTGKKVWMIPYSIDMYPRWGTVARNLSAGNANTKVKNLKNQGGEMKKSGGQNGVFERNVKFIVLKSNFFC
jgi:hypothetical protein